jgi:hypothetical protein
LPAIRPAQVKPLGRWVEQPDFVIAITGPVTHQGNSGRVLGAKSDRPRYEIATDPIPEMEATPQRVIHTDGISAVAIPVAK